MTTLSWLHTLAPISLEQINAQAGLQTRIDRKYLVDRTEAENLISWIDPESRVLEIDGKRALTYHSVYFDTPDLVSYRQAAQSRARRFKLRTRVYCDTQTAFLEAKLRGSRGQTVKKRIPHQIDRISQLGPEDSEFAATAMTIAGLNSDQAETLMPTLSTQYRRVTLALPAQQEEESISWMTIDTDLRWELPPGSPDSLNQAAEAEPAGQLHRPDLAIIETKSVDGVSSVDRQLWSRGLRPISISKYCTGLAALRPELKANKWHRLLNQRLRTPVQRERRDTQPLHQIRSAS